VLESWDSNCIVFYRIYLWDIYLIIYKTEIQFNSNKKIIYIA
jgi:hypothetical protein